MVFGGSLGRKNHRYSGRTTKLTREKKPKRLYEGSKEAAINISPAKLMEGQHLNSLRGSDLCWEEKKRNIREKKRK